MSTPHTHWCVYKLSMREPNKIHLQLDLFHILVHLCMLLVSNVTDPDCDGMFLVPNFTDPDCNGTFLNVLMWLYSQHPLPVALSTNIWPGYKLIVNILSGSPVTFNYLFFITSSAHFIGQWSESLLFDWSFWYAIWWSCKGGNEVLLGNGCYK